MPTRLAAAVIAVSFALPAHAGSHASGDAEAGESEFRKCKSCHMIESADETIVKGGRTGPNLYGIVGRVAGTYEDFRYSKLFEAAAEQGITWDEETFVAYVQDPTPYMQELTGDGARGKMTYKVRDEEDAINLWAYLASVSPEPEMKGDDSGS